MSYIDNNLAANEKIIYRCKPHWIIFSPIVLFLLFAIFLMLYGKNVIMLGTNFYKIAAIASLIFAVLSGISIYLIYLTAEYGITDKRVIMKIGLIQQRIIEIPLDRIESMYVYRNLLGLLLNYGTITISGVGGTKDTYKNIPKPYYFRKQVQDQTNKIAESYANK